MTAGSDMDDVTRLEIERQIVAEVTPQGLGDGSEVVCDDCNGTIGVTEVAKCYVVGDDTGSTWTISRVLHPDCSQHFTESRIGDSDETEGLVYGKVVRDPRVADLHAKGRDATEERFEEMFGPAEHVRGPLPNHRLSNVFVGPFNVMSAEAREEKHEQMLRFLAITDHLDTEFDFEAVARDYGYDPDEIRAQLREELPSDHPLHGWAEDEDGGPGDT